MRVRYTIPEEDDQADVPPKPYSPLAAKSDRWFVRPARTLVVPISIAPTNRQPYRLVVVPALVDTALSGQVLLSEGALKNQYDLEIANFTPAPFGRTLEDASGKLNSLPQRQCKFAIYRENGSDEPWVRGETNFAYYPFEDVNTTPEEAALPGPSHCLIGMQTLEQLGLDLEVYPTKGTFYLVRRVSWFLEMIGR